MFALTMDTRHLSSKLRSNSPWKRLDALEQVARDDPEAGVLMARICISDNHDAVRCGAVKIIAEFVKAKDRYRLLTASHDKSWDVRSSVVTALEHLKSAWATARLKEMFVNDRHFVVRRDAAFALRLAHHDGEAALMQALRTEKDLRVRSNILAGLYELGHYECLQTMLDLLADDTFVLRDNVVNTLGLMDIRVSDKDRVRRALNELLTWNINNGERGNTEIVLSELEEKK